MSAKKKILLFIFFLAIIIFLAWFFFGTINTIALKVKKQDAIKGIAVTGNVESTEDVEITSSVTAKTEKILAKTGDTVKKGEILAYLDREDLLGELEAAKARIQTIQEQLQRNRVQYQDALSNEKRYEDLYDQGAVSQRDLEERTLRRQELEESIDEKTQEIRAARGELKAVRGRLDNYIIKAPVSGIITDKFISTGDIVSPQQPIFRLVVPENIYLEADVEENALDSVKPGQKVLVIFDAYPEKIFTERIYLISKEVNPVTGTFETRITRPPDSKVSIFVGMTFDATIIVEEYRNIIVIPTDYVEFENSKTYVFRKEGFLARKTRVDTKVFDNNTVRILKGIKEGEVILKPVGGRQLTDNAKIKVKKFQEQK